jgi:hypothetical protein
VMYPTLAMQAVRRVLTTDDLAVIDEDGGGSPEALMAARSNPVAAKSTPNAPLPGNIAWAGPVDASSLAPAFPAAGSGVGSKASRPSSSKGIGVVGNHSVVVPVSHGATSAYDQGSGPFGVESTNHVPVTLSASVPTARRALGMRQVSRHHSS